eukprot:CFRG8105T1
MSPISASNYARDDTDSDDNNSITGEWEKMNSHVCTSELRTIKPNNPFDMRCQPYPVVADIEVMSQNKVVDNEELRSQPLPKADGTTVLTLKHQEDRPREKAAQDRRMFTSLLCLLTSIVNIGCLLIFLSSLGTYSEPDNQKASLEEIVNAISYIRESGCSPSVVPVWVIDQLAVNDTSLLDWVMMSSQCDGKVVPASLLLALENNDRASLKSFLENQFIMEDDVAEVLLESLQKFTIEAETLELIFSYFKANRRVLQTLVKTHDEIEAKEATVFEVMTIPHVMDRIILPPPVASAYEIMNDLLSSWLTSLNSMLESMLFNSTAGRLFDCDSGQECNLAKNQDLNHFHPVKSKDKIPSLNNTQDGHIELESATHRMISAALYADFPSDGDFELVSILVRAHTSAFEEEGAKQIGLREWKALLKYAETAGLDRLIEITGVTSDRISDLIHDAWY